MSVNVTMRRCFKRRPNAGLLNSCAKGSRSDSQAKIAAVHLRLKHGCPFQVKRSGSSVCFVIPIRGELSI